MTRRAVLVLLLASCGGSEGPTLTSLTLLGQAPQRPLTLEMRAAFKHPTGELGLGELVLSVDGEESSRLSAGAVFGAQSPPLGLAATAGLLRFEISLEPPIAAGQELAIGLYAIDRLGNESNERSLLLRATAPAGGS